MTWVSPNNVNLAAITGNFGLGVNPLPTFDWNQFLVDPLITPFFTTFNFFLGTLFTVPIIAALWYSNTWQTGYLPINTNSVFDNTGSPYNVTRAIGSDTLFNQTLYEEYSPAYMSASNALLYGLRSTLRPSATHCFTTAREILHGLRSIFSRRKTSELHKCIHVRLMESYQEIREWQVLVFAIALGAAGVGAYPHKLPQLWSCMECSWRSSSSVPVGIIAATTNVEITLAEMLGGLWFPGNSTTMNYFKSYGFVTTSQTISFASDLKLAHYCHINPRKVKVLEDFHLPVFLMGGLIWAPYSMANVWPAVPIGYLFKCLSRNDYPVGNKYN
ncbi:OPT oligopeptide transporter protein-domain-containing protein [Mycena epipterygia]|nr:OPT oligopeptide transporter protein-domain-containing protein [Mycena epipterygia]